MSHNLHSKSTLIKISGEGLDNLKINRHLKLRYSRGGLEKYNTKSHLNTFLNHSKFNVSTLRQNNFNAYLKNREFLFYQYFWYIQLEFIGKENPIWAGEDLIKKFCLPIELVWRQDIRTAQNINNKGFSPETPEISLQRLNSKI